MKITGTLVYQDLGSGSWVLHADDGAAYDLDVGALDRRSLERVRGQRIDVIAQKADRMGFGMAGGTTLVVGSVKPAR